MSKKTLNRNLHRAKRVKKDEFYTQLSDIERELGHYREHFRGKTIFCNCDDPKMSNFWKYFNLKFDFFGLKKLIATHYDYDYEKSTYKLERDGNNLIKTSLKENGDFRSPECVELLEEADIVVTNPPFSLFREYVAQLMEYEKDFVIIGSKNAVTYKEFFPLIKDDKIWVGMMRMGRDLLFGVPEGVAKDMVENSKRGSTYRIVDGVVYARSPSIWYTNLDIPKRHDDLILYKKYSSEEYPKYDNYDVIEVSRTIHIPVDYEGVMGVPITFLDKYNPDQFEILGIANSARWIGYECLTVMDGRNIYNRIIIKHRRPQL